MDATPAFVPAQLPGERFVLVDLLNRVLAQSVVVTGDINLSVADVDMVTVSLRTARIARWATQISQGVRYRLDPGEDQQSVECGLAALVLTLVELLRQLMERQALRRVEEGTVTDEQTESSGTC